MMYSFFKILYKLRPTESIYAHCDIPCGIYTTEPMTTAALTVARMVEKINETADSDIHSISRFVATKEKHAQICKDEILILWTDYFKQEHLEMFPTLHEVCWKATKLCSRVKQEGTRAAAQELEQAVGQIAKMFDQAEAQKQ